MSVIKYTCALCGQVQDEYRNGSRVRNFTDAELRARDERIIRQTLLYVNAPHDWFDIPDAGVAGIITAAEADQ